MKSPCSKLRYAGRFFRFACILALIVVLMPLRALSAELSPGAFDTANKIYDEGKYEDAVAAFEKLTESGQISTAVYFNLGNAYFKSGQLGRAIAAYRRAEELSPRDQDIHANLQFARNQVQGPTVASTRVQQFLRKLSLNEWTVVAFTFLWACFVLSSVLQLRPALRATLRNYIVGLGIIAGFTCVCLGGSYAEARSFRTAFVVSRNAVVHNGPLDESPSAFTAHDGAEFRVLDQKDEWLQVSVENRVGWVKKKEVLLQ